MKYLKTEPAVPDVIEQLREQFEGDKTESMCMRYSDDDEDNEQVGQYLDERVQANWERFLGTKGYQVSPH